MNLLGFFCIFLVFLGCFERESTMQVGACVLPYHIFFHTAASKMVWPWWLADSHTHVKCAFVCALRCEWVCGCSVSIFYFSISLFVTMNGKDQTLAFMCELTDIVCDVFVLHFSLFFSPRCPYDTIRHANISSLHYAL